ncbi:MAG TPA: cob(I)yrinic acid a,c-diamide adenosyltransferase [Spirochaetia bacterium]
MIPDSGAPPIKGYLHVYTGNGKGKTTAAIGLAIRAAGAGKRVFFGQFVKGSEYSEIKALRRFEDRIVVRQYGLGCFLHREPGKNDRDAGREGLVDAGVMLTSGAYDLVILDEACIALHYKLFTLTELLDALRSRHPSCEVVVTGRYAPLALIKEADLVTEMREIKHYYTTGVMAREGIER